MRRRRGGRKLQAAATTATYNQIGQKLGRKGQETRERILCAMLRLLECPDGPPVTLTGVANEASVRLTNLYLYFPDMSELVLAALDRVMESADAGFIEKLRVRWPDDGIEDACLEFLRAHHEFWSRNARLLHMRNALADAGDLRILDYRNDNTRPLIDLLEMQMESADAASDKRLATVLMTCLERLATVVTNRHFPRMFEVEEGGNRNAYVQDLLESEAGMIAGAILRQRTITG